MIRNWPLVAIDDLERCSVYYSAVMRSDRKVRCGDQVEGDNRLTGTVFFIIIKLSCISSIEYISHFCSTSV